MPCLSGRFDPAIGPLVNLAIAAAGSVTAVASSAPPAGLQAFPALIDTGATITCISPTIVQALQLQARGKRPMGSATHQVVPVNVYLVDLILPFGPTALVLDNRQVMEVAPPANSAFQALVGRDILCQGAFTLSFDGHFTFCL
jgi:hypothetical protein